MLAPIPQKILRTNAEVQICTGTDRYQNQTYDVIQLTKVHLQPTERIIKSVDNTDQQLTSILFVDRRHSQPSLDWRSLLQHAHDAGGDMRVIIRGVTYTVVSADGLRDDSDHLHHWEIGLV